MSQIAPQRIFLSYSSSDRHRVNGLSLFLEAMGHDVFLDHKVIKPGQKWENRLHEGLDEADALCVFWTKNSAGSGWVRNEYEYFHVNRSEQPLIPILGDETPLPELLSAYQHADFVPMINELLNYVRSMSGSVSKKQLQKEIMQRLEEAGIDIPEKDRKDLFLTLGATNILSFLLSSSVLFAVPIAQLSLPKLITIIAASALTGYVFCNKCDECNKQESPSVSDPSNVKINSTKYPWVDILISILSGYKAANVIPPVSIGKDPDSPRERPSSAPTSIPPKTPKRNPEEDILGFFRGNENVQYRMDMKIKDKISANRKTSGTISIHPSQTAQVHRIVQGRRLIAQSIDSNNFLFGYFDDLVSNKDFDSIDIFLSSSNEDIVEVDEKISININPNRASYKQFKIKTNSVQSPTEVTITAFCKDQEICKVQKYEKSFVVNPLDSPPTPPGPPITPPLPSSSLQGFFIRQSSPQTFSGTVSLNRAEPLRDVPVALRSSSPGVVVIPESVIIPKGKTKQTFEVKASPVNTNTKVIITASYQGHHLEQILTLETPPSPILQSLLLPSSVEGGQPISGIVRLNRVDPSRGVPVTLKSNPTGVVAFRERVSIPKGEIKQNFTVETKPVDINTSVVITASHKGHKVEKKLVLRAKSSVPVPKLSSLTLGAPRLLGGLFLSGTVRLDRVAPPQGVLVTLNSPQSNLVAIPRTLLIPYGKSSLNFKAQTKAVEKDSPLEITASHQGRNLKQTTILEPFRLPDQRFPSDELLTGTLLGIGSGIGTSLVVGEPSTTSSQPIRRVDLDL